MQEGHWPIVGNRVSEGEEERKCVDRQVMCVVAWQSAFGHTRVLAPEVGRAVEQRVQLS